MADAERGSTPGLEAARRMLQELVPFNAYLGLEVTWVGASRAEVCLPDRQELQNHVGTQHAAALFAAGEAASGAAVAGLLVSRYGPELTGVTPLATRAEIRYLRPAKGPIVATGEILAEPDEVTGRLQSEGKVEFPVRVTLADLRGRAVAEMTVWWYVRKR
jgi:acyl-coenzyme A thioesterase PaaI-like protein